MCRCQSPLGICLTVVMGMGILERPRDNAISCQRSTTFAVPAASAIASWCKSGDGPGTGQNRQTFKQSCWAIDAAAVAFRTRREEAGGQARILEVSFSSILDFSPSKTLPSFRDNRLAVSYIFLFSALPRCLISFAPFRLALLSNALRSRPLPSAALRVIALLNALPSRLLPFAVLCVIVWLNALPSKAKRSSGKKPRERSLITDDER